MLKLHNFRKEIISGIDRNLIVYDGSAKPGEFTKRLVALMKVCCRQNKVGKLNKIIVENDLMMEDILVPVVVDNIDNGCKMQILKCDIIFTDDKISEEFTKLCGSFAPDDKYLVIGICDNGEVLLGSC